MTVELVAVEQRLWSGTATLVSAQAGRDRAEPFREREGPDRRVRGGRSAEPGEGADEFAVAVIGRVGAENAALAGGEPRHAQRDLVRLGAAATQDDALDLRAVQRGEAFAELDNGFVQVAAVDVQRRLLACHRLDHARVGVADTGDVVVHVDIAAAVGVKQVAALAADDMQRMLVEQRGAGAQRAVAAGEQGGGVGHVASGAGDVVGARREPTMRPRRYAMGGRG